MRPSRIIRLASLGADRYLLLEYLKKKGILQPRSASGIIGMDSTAEPKGEQGI